MSRQSKQPKKPAKNSRSSKEKGDTAKSEKPQNEAATSASPQVDATEIVDNMEKTEAEVVEAELVENEEPENGTSDASLVNKSSNSYLRRLMETNFLEFAAYVIKERAIPDVDDGLKPVQRRILWSLIRMDDGKFHKVANVIGHTMQFHPHGDASIGDALVVLANKEYYIDKQGNFGNIFTGDSASAARYIECRLNSLAKEILFNNDITEFVDSYDGRNREPVRLPAKLPSLLMLGADGIAVGMATHILPHNFRELIEAQIAILQGEDFEIYPDFLQGGMMDVSEYEEGNGKVTVRAKIEREGRKLFIREIPASTTTESLIASIEKAAARNKIKVASITDFTAEHVEIEIVPMRGYEPEKALNALYAYTDCSVSISVNLMVICEGRPVQMTVPEVIRRNTDKLLDHLKRELEIELGKLEDKWHDRSLERIFIENRIYKRIEECETNDLVFQEVHKGLNKFRKMLKRDISDEDIQRLLAIPIRRISLFDINKNKQELDDIIQAIEQVHKNLKRLKAYATKYLKNILDKYGKQFPRRTVIDQFDTIDRKKVALNNIKVGWDRKNCYIGTSIRSDEQVTCNEYDHLLCIERSGKYKVINIPDKLYIGRLFYFSKYDKSTEFAVIYKEKKTGKCYYKRCVIDKFITDKEYELCPAECKIEVITTRINSLYECSTKARVKSDRIIHINLAEAPERSSKARGLLVSTKPIVSFKFLGLVGDGESEDDSSAPEKDDDSSESTDKPQPTRDISSSSSTTPSATSEDDDILELNSDVEDEKPRKKAAKTDSSGEKKIRKAPPKGGESGKGGEDLGITQPEFGF